jgi:hypothetical protein
VNGEWAKYEQSAFIDLYSPLTIHHSQMRNTGSFNQIIMMKTIIVLLLLPLAITAQKNYPQLLDDYAQAEFKIKDFNGAVLVVQKGKPFTKKHSVWPTGNGMYPIPSILNSG